MPPGNVTEMTDRRAAGPGVVACRRRGGAVNEAERNVRAIRGRLLSFLRAPHGAGDAQSYRYIEDGIVLVKDGRIEAAGPAAELMPRLPAAARSNITPTR